MLSPYLTHRQVPESAASHPAGMSHEYRHLRAFIATFRHERNARSLRRIIIQSRRDRRRDRPRAAGRGWTTLTVDKAASAGAGSTINSCAIVRFSYSSVEGTNLAWEGMHYWKDWPAYIGTVDELGLIDYHMTGQLVFQPPGEGTHAARVKALWDEMDIPHETWDAATIKERLPCTSIRACSVPRLVPTTMPSGRTRRGRSSAAISPPTQGM